MSPVLLKSDGAVYDAYTMDRWSDPERSDYMEQQSAHEAGKPWNKLTDMGSNMKQMTAGPDGNPMSAFRGKKNKKHFKLYSFKPPVTISIILNAMLTIQNNSLSCCY